MRCSRQCSIGCSRSSNPNSANRHGGLARRRSLYPPAAAPRGSSSSSRRRQAVLLRSLPDSASVSTRSSVIASRFGDLAWASCVSSKPTVATAIADAAGAILAAQQQHQRGGGGGGDFEPQLAVVFASCNYGPQLEGVVAAIRAAVPSVRYIFGCSAFGVLGSSAGGPLEVEGEPGLALSLAALPGCQLSVIHTLRSSIPTEDAGPEAWSDLVGISPLEPLQHSRPPSAAGSADSDDKDDPAAAAAAAAAAASSNSSNGNGNQGAAGSSSAAAVEQAPPDSGQPLGSSREQPQQAAAAAQPPGEAVSFLLLCDPRFQQSKQLLAGLDFAFPAANKVGGVLSQGQANKRRLMFAWSADGAMQPGTAAWQRKQARRRRQQQQAALAASQGPTNSSSSSTGPMPMVQPPVQQLQQPPAPSAVQQQAADATQQQQQQPAVSKAPKKGLFGSLFDALLSGLSDEEQQQPPQAAAAGQQGIQRGAAAGSDPAAMAAGGLTPAAEAAAAAASDVGSADDDGDDEDDSDGSNGVFMYGAAVLAIKGPVALEPITCQGYRTIGDKVWTVGETSRDGDLIATLIDPDAAAAGAGPDGGSGAAGSGGDVSVDASMEEEGGGEVVPLVALFELLLQAGYDPEDSSPRWIEALSESLAVAVAPDSFTPDAALQPDDFTVAAIAEVWQSSGCIRIAGQARPGYRLKLVVRDDDGVRQDLSAKLLGLKRAELAGMLAGERRPPPLAALLFSDIGRGSSRYEAPSYESSVVASFLPVPLSGMFGSAQISTANGKAGLYELTNAIAVLRPLVPPKQQQQEQQQQEQQQQV